MRRAFVVVPVVVVAGVVALAVIGSRPGPVDPMTRHLRAACSSEVDVVAIVGKHDGSDTSAQMAAAEHEAQLAMDLAGKDDAKRADVRDLPGSIALANRSIGQDPGRDVYLQPGVAQVIDACQQIEPPSK